MTDLGTLFREADRIDTPDLWPEIAERIAAEDTSSRGLETLEDRDPRRRLEQLVAIAAALILAAVAIGALARAFRSEEMERPGTTVPTPGITTPTPPPAVGTPSGGRITIVAGSRRFLEIDPDGRAQPVSTGTGGGLPLAWSADGKRLVMDRSQQLLIMDWNGETTRLLDHALVDSASWSPDGRRIVFAQNGSLRVVDADGAGLRTLLRRGVMTYDHPDWSPDGSTIAYRRFSSTHSSHEQLWLMDADGSNPRPFVTSVDCGSLAWSPDGSTIAFTTAGNGRLYLADVRTGHLTRINDGSNRAYYLDWSPDGTRIAYVGAHSGGLEVMNADGSVVHTVYPVASNKYIAVVLWHREAHQ